jgi:hypothetical protein
MGDLRGLQEVIRQYDSMRSVRAAYMVGGMVVLYARHVDRMKWKGGYRAPTESRGKLENLTYSLQEKPFQSPLCLHDGA